MPATKRVLIVVALLAAMILPQTARAAGPTFVQIAAATPQSPAASVSRAYTTAQIAGNTNVVAIGWNDTTTSIVSVADSAGNTYQIGAPTFRGGGLSQAIYYAQNIKAGSNTVTVTFNQPAAYLDLRITEYSGLAGGTDGSASQANSSSSGNLTTTNAADLLFAAGMTTGAFSGAGSGYTLRIITSPDADIVEDRSVTATGTYSATANGATGIMQLLALRASGSTSTPVPTNTPAATNTPGPTNTPAPPTPTPPPGSSPYPLSVSGRQLLTQQGTSFLMMGDSPQSLIGNISLANAEAYFADRQAQGFNTVWINLLCNAYTYCNSDGSTFDGIHPFTSDNDISTPNPAYFAKVDQVLQLAANHGLLVVLDPAETGGWAPTFIGQGSAKAYNYGAFVGQRYRNQPNIVWMSGNDWQDWRNSFNDNIMKSVAQGIKDNDPNHIHTVELDYQRSDSTDDANWLSLISLDAAYTYFPVYDYVLRGYNASIMPVFLVEGNYEFENNTGNDPGTPALLRRQLWWTMTSGGIGQLYGNLYSVRFQSGWQSNLDTPGAAQQHIASTFLHTFAWDSLVPDQTHHMLTGGFGTYDGNTSMHASNYATGAQSADGALGLIYAPTATTLQVDLSTFSGSVTATWFDPATGASSAAGTFANSGSHGFATPGGHADGATDWVLLLRTGGGPPPTATPAPPTSTPVPPTPTATPGHQFTQTLNVGDSVQVNCTGGTLSIVSQSQTSDVLTCQ